MEIPIIIIGFNNYTYIKQMVDQLYKYNLNNIYIIDNNSTYPLLLDYYDNNPGLKVIKLSINYGYNVLFKECMRDFYKSLPKYFILTDPDIEFNKKLPKEFVSILINLSNQHKIGKVGFAIDINDNEIDLSKPFVMMGNFFKGKDDEMMCDYYSDGLNYTKDEKIKNEINTLIADNCNDITELNQKN